MTLGEYVLSRCVECGDCLLWTGALNGSGYPEMNTGRFGKGRPVQRLWIATYGTYDTRRKRIINTCGERRCCVLAHWRLVTAGEVIRRQYAQRRRGSPEMVYRAGLKGALKRTDLPGSPERAAEARQLRAQGLTVVQIAAKLGISKPTAQRWAAGTAYRPPNPWAI